MSIVNRISLYHGAEVDGCRRGVSGGEKKVSRPVLWNLIPTAILQVRDIR